MEITLVLLIVFYLVFYLLRPTSKEELKRFNKKDNWSNMGFWKENMKKIIIIFALLSFSTSVFAGSCPMMANKVEKKIEEAKKFHADGLKAHQNGDHKKSEELLNKALDLFKS